MRKIQLIAKITRAEAGKSQGKIHHHAEGFEKLTDIIGSDLARNDCKSLVLLLEEIRKKRVKHILGERRAKIKAEIAKNKRPKKKK